jgi:tetratricopeptide (TPR) repeat protein
MINILSKIHTFISKAQYISMDKGVLLNEAKKIFDVSKDMEFEARRINLKSIFEIGNRVLQLDSNCAEIHYWMGKAYSSLRQQEKALSQFETAIKKSPEYIEAHFESGILYNNRFDCSKNIDIKNQAVSKFVKVLKHVKGKEKDYPQIFEESRNRLSRLFVVNGDIEKNWADIQGEEKNYKLSLKYYHLALKLIASSQFKADILIVDPYHKAKICHKIAYIYKKLDKPDLAKKFSKLAANFEKGGAKRFDLQLFAADPAPEKLKHEAQTNAELVNKYIADVKSKEKGTRSVEGSFPDLNPPEKIETIKLS